MTQRADGGRLLRRLDMHGPFDRLARQNGADVVRTKQSAEAVKLGGKHAVRPAFSRRGGVVRCAMAELIYKIVAREEWWEAERGGVFEGSAVDRRDGFIHFSTAAQVRETAARHFQGDANLFLVAVAVDALTLRWEPSRGGDLFPHLYGPLPLTAVRSVAPLPLGADGTHAFTGLPEGGHYTVSKTA